MKQPTPKPDRRMKRGEGSKPVYVASRRAFRVRPPRAPGAKWQSDIWVRATGPDDSSAEAEAWRILRRELHQRETTGVVRRQDRRTTVGAWMTRYVGTDLEPGLATNVRPQTRRTQRYIAKHLVRELGTIRLVALAPSDVSGMLGRLEARGLTANRRYAVLSLLRVALDLAIRDERIGRNVADLVDSPRRVQSSIRAPQPDEVKAILADVLEDPVYGAAYAVAIATGLRQGEVLGLRWRDVIVEPVTGQPAVLVETTLEWGTDRLGEGPKSASGKRLVPLAPFAVEALEQRRRWQMANGSTSSAGFIFTVPASWPDQPRGSRWPRPAGSPMRGSTLYEHYRRTLVRLGLAPYRWHDLRHEALTRMLAKADIRRVQRIAGHASMATTARYLHSVGDDAAALDPFAEARG